MRLILDVDQSDVPSRFIVDAEPDSLVGDLLSSLGLSPSTQWYVGATALDPSLALKDSLLRDGIVVSSQAREPLLVNQLSSNGQLVANIRSTTSHTWSLPYGPVSVGRDSSNAVVLDDPEVSARHLVLEVTGTQLRVTDLGSTNGTFVFADPQQRREGVALPANVAQFISANATVMIGASSFRVNMSGSLDVDLRLDGEGGIQFNRPSRLREPLDTYVVRLPDELNEREMQVDLLSSAAGGATGLAYGSYIPIIGTGINVALQKRRQKMSKREIQKRKTEHEQELAKIDEAIGVEIVRQKKRLHEIYPDPEQLLTMALAPDRRLWERRFIDTDAGDLRVGLGVRSADIAFEYRGDRPEVPLPQLVDVPILINLNRIGVLGIAGARASTVSHVRWFLAQMAFFRPPRDVIFSLLTGDSTGSDWDWITLLPHAAQIPKVSPFLVGNSPTTLSARISELTSLLDERLELQRDNPAASIRPDVVVILDGARVLRATPGVVRLLREGPRVGIQFLAVDEETARLPEEARGEILITTSGDATIRIDGEKSRYGVSPDRVNEPWLTRFARTLCPLRLTSHGAGGELPTSLRFVDMVELDLADPSSVFESWRRGGRTTEAWVGNTASEALILDLQRDGPHALIAGTTGAGKSEFLQTLIAALALGNRPDALNFVLVDYKGASAFAECERLPHTVGVVTNLDGHLTERALASLDAELHRREIVLKDLGVADINSAWQLHATEAAERGLARLVLIIDEFAEMVQELPDFVTGLIRIARVGRSLGVHLVLATQRPTGVVTPEMRANTGLRVALRMQDRADSAEVIDAPNAASVSRLTPGRGFVRTGGSGQLTEFQTARVGGPAPSATVEAAPVTVAKLSWGDVGEPVKLNYARAPKSRVTDLALICSLIESAATLGNFSPPRRPWLDPLPPHVPLSSLTFHTRNTLIRGESRPDQHGFDMPVGIIDIPAQQAQEQFVFSISESSNWGVAGGPRSGKTSMLATIAAAIARNCSAADVHIYALDLGGGGLLALSALPHCGAVVRANEGERFEAFVGKLTNEHRRRQQLLAENGAATISEQRDTAAPEMRLPYMVVLIDRWELIAQEFPPESGSTVVTELTRLIREASSTGIRFVLAGDRGLLSDRVFSHLGVRLALRLSDLNDYRQIDLQPRTIATHMGPGRAVRSGDGSEIQFAYLADLPHLPLRDAIEELAATLSHEPVTGQIRVDALPERVSASAAQSLARHAISDAEATMALFVGGDTLSQIMLDPFAHRGGFLIAGPPRSGRSSISSRMAFDAVSRGVRVVVAADASRAPYELLNDQIEFIGAPDFADPTTVIDTLGDGRVLLVIDDIERFLRSALDSAVVEILGTNELVRVVMVGTADELASDLRGVASTIKRNLFGVILRPQSPIDGQLFGQRIDRTLLGGPLGRGQLFVNGEQIRVQAVSN